MNKLIEATIAAIVLMTGTAFAQTNTPQQLPACTAASYISFDAASGVTTFPTSINGRGEITGFYYPIFAEQQLHGFVRAVDGTITTFDGLGSSSSLPTFPLSISSSGEIMGGYYDEKISHGFLRSPDGIFTSFNAPGAFDTIPTSMNSRGEITGIAQTTGSADVFDFLRAPDGTFTTFDIEGTAPHPPVLTHGATS